MSTFFKNTDRSESVEKFIKEKSEHLHNHSELRWVISKEKKGFFVKAVTKTECFTGSDKNIYKAISAIIGHIKAKESKISRVA